MNDLISRKWLVECIEEGWIRFDTEKDYNRMIHLVRDTAPSVQPEADEWCKDCKEYNIANHNCPRFIRTIKKTVEEMKEERKKGKWILDDDGIPAICSECGTNWIDDYVDSRELYFTGKIPNFCPNCGSDNRGEQE